MTGNVITATVSGVFLLLAGLLNLAPWASDRRNRRYLEAQRRIDVARDTLSKQGELCRDIQQAVRSAHRRARDMANFIDDLAPEPPPGPELVNLLLTAIGRRDLDLAPELAGVRGAVADLEALSERFGHEFFNVSRKKKSLRSSIQLRNLLNEMLRVDARLVAAKEDGLKAIGEASGSDAVHRRSGR